MLDDTLTRDESRIRVAEAVPDPVRWEPRAGMSQSWREVIEQLRRDARDFLSKLHDAIDGKSESPEPVPVPVPVRRRGGRDDS